MPKFRPPNRGKRATPVTLSAPTGGLNGRDALSEMAATDAFQLDNWFPYSTSVDTRGGSLDFSTGLGAAVESLETYTGVNAKMLAFSGGHVHDVTLGGAVGAALISGRTSNLVNAIMFSNAGSQFLLIYSGADAPLSYDGTTLTALVITGLTGSQNLLHTGMVFKGRVFLGQANQLGFYYLAVGAIQGAASFFDLQQQCLKGGQLAAMVSFSKDSGNGPADYAVFVTTEGEYLMYAGTDPSNAATWALVGRYYGPTPIGRKSWFKFRADVYFITEEGILPFSKILGGAQDKHDTTYITDKLGRNYTDATLYQNTPGWAGMIYPKGNALLVNVPITGATSGPYIQFAMNTTTNAWCRYRGWDALCWALFAKRAYFGTHDGRVVLADEGITDNGVEVQGVARQAWNTFDDENGMGQADKHFHFATFAMQSDGAPAIACSLNINFEDDQPLYSSALGTSNGAEWDTATWDVDDWAGAPATQDISISVGKLGYIGSLWMQAAATASRIRWFATRIILEKTRGVLLS